MEDQVYGENIGVVETGKEEQHREEADVKCDMIDGMKRPSVGRWRVDCCSLTAMNDLE